jgi:hypothetical protein
MRVAEAFRATLLAVLLAAPSFAQPVGSSTCSPPDVISIRDDGPGKAVVTYLNSVNRCSAETIGRLTSPNGISVDFRIELTGEENDYRERIILNPVDADMMAFPPEDDLLDGETQEFIVMGGLA